MYISLRIKVISLLFILITSLALIINESSTSLIHEKTIEIFQQRIEMLSESIKSYWDSEKNQILNNAMLYAESERIINFSTYGLHNLLQKELERLISKTGFHELEIILKDGLRISSNLSSSARAPVMDSMVRNLSLVFVELINGELFVTAEVPINKLGEFIGRLSLRRRLDDARMSKMARNLQAEVSLAVKDAIVASSLPESQRKELMVELLRSGERKEDIFRMAFSGVIHSIGRVSIEKTQAGDPTTLYTAVSQQKMLSLVKQARSQNLEVTAWILVIALLLSVIFSETVLIKRIKKINEGANVVASGNLGFQITIAQGDEIGNLAGSFNLMASSLKQNQEKLQHYIQRIEKLANYIQNILGSLRTCVITWNLERKIETANEACVAELGDIFPEIEGISLRTFLKRLSADSRIRMLGAFREVLSPEFDRQFDIEFNTGEHGSLKVFQADLSLLLDNEKKPYGLILTLTNITQKKIIEQQLYHADKLSSIGQLAASVAHEIKNPLASIKTLGQLLQEETEAEDSRREYIDVIVDEVNRLNGVVEQLLKYARPEGSSFREVGFAEVIQPVLALVNHESERQRVEISAEYDSDLQVFVDSEKIKQVFINLIFNGIQAMPEGGKIVLRAFKEVESPWAVFEVEDSGAGMPQKVLERVFEPFFTTRQRGTGLGLAIVKKIVDLHGGKIEVSSEASRGTRFRFFLPSKQEGKK